MEQFKSTMDLVSDLTQANKELSSAVVKNAEIARDTVTRIIIGFVIVVAIIAAVLSYDIYQGYNYEGYPTNEITNTNTNTNTNGGSK